jgi:DNA-directed RNA polymerase specialized sigma subunit
VWSLDTPAGEDSTLQQLLENLQAPQPYEELVRTELSHTLDGLLSLLPERQSLVLRLHFGMEGGECLSLDQIGKRLGISKERARQLERQAIDKLPEREAMVIKLRYFHSLTQDRVSKVLQVSQVQVSRIEKRALAHLKELLE